MWNFNMDEAPKGHVTEAPTKCKDGSSGTQYGYEFAPVIACDKTGDCVTLTHWLPKQKRWNRFATNETPLAWMPWPEHPQGETA
jgi:hypothetical protein